jgi:hypothetical protein
MDPVNVKVDRASRLSVGLEAFTSVITVNYHLPKCDSEYIGTCMLSCCFCLHKAKVVLLL